MGERFLIGARTRCPRLALLKRVDGVFTEIPKDNRGQWRESWVSVCRHVLTKGQGMFTHRQPKTENWNRPLPTSLRRKKPAHFLILDIFPPRNVKSIPFCGSSHSACFWSALRCTNRQCIVNWWWLWGIHGEGKMESALERCFSWWQQQCQDKEKCQRACVVLHVWIGHGEIWALASLCSDSK